MGIPVAHRDEKAHRRLIASLLNLIDGQRPITYDPIDVSTGSPQNAEFENIPNWVQRITLSLVGVSNSNTSNLIIQLKDSAWVTSGYLGAGSTIGSAVSTTNGTAGIMVRSATASYVFHGSVILTKNTSDIWVAQGVVGQSDSARSMVTGGSITLSGELTGIRLRSNTGTFNAGSVGCRVER